MAPACDFCGKPAKSKEHIIASQIVELLATDPRGFSRPTNLMLSHGFGGPIVQTRRGKPGGTKSKPTVEFTRRVCKGCNNGWMNRVDLAAMPSLARMMRGDPLVLDVDAQAKVAAWIAKVAVVSRFAHLPHHIGEVPAPVAKSWTAWLYTHHTALPHWHVWLARYNGSEPFIYSGEDIRVDAEGQGTIIPHGVYATIVLGYLGIQLLGLDEGAVLLDPYSDPYRVSSIWPERKSDVGWPPWLSYDDSNVRGFVHRLTPQAPIPPGMVDGGGRQIDWSAYGGSEE